VGETINAYKNTENVAGISEDKRFLGDKRM
jgi:hypothetical protein